ncbi:nuclear transport factor 2 family protein [Actinomadura napierensis]|uniref:SnoaL-like domain-containing protein n=1 Tax=Actinomadura napierensis TaxID=267854 RepID=A0ABN2YQW5_9ACTN
MPDETVRKKLALDYCRFMNAGDVDAVLALFVDDVRFEDPVGADPILGRRALRAHLAQAIEHEVRETAGDPVAALDDEHVVMPITVSLRPPGAEPGQRLRINLVAMMSVGPDELIRQVRVFWGRTDATLVPGG